MAMLLSPAMKLDCGPFMNDLETKDLQTWKLHRANCACRLKMLRGVSAIWLLRMNGWTHTKIYRHLVSVIPAPQPVLNEPSDPCAMH